MQPPATLQRLSWDCPAQPDHLSATAAGASPEILATVDIISGNTTCGLAGIGSSTITVACIGVGCPTCVPGNESCVYTCWGLNHPCASVAHQLSRLSHDSTEQQY